MLRELTPDQLWIADMPAQRMGFELGARMTVVRLQDGSLFIHSPIELDDGLKQAIDKLGPVRCLVSPSRFHYLHVAEFARAYPDASVYAVPGSARKLKGLQLHGALGDTPEPAWAGVLDQSVFRGSALYDEVDFFHRPSRTLILTDLCFFIPTNRSRATRLTARMLGILGQFAPSRSFRLSLRDRHKAGESVERILAWDFDRIIISHGEIVETGGKATFHRAFAWLLA